MNVKRRLVLSLRTIKTVLIRTLRFFKSTIIRTLRFFKSTIIRTLRFFKSTVIRTLRFFKILLGRVLRVWKRVYLLASAPKRVYFQQTEVPNVRYRAGDSVGTKIVWIVSLTGVSNEPRVLRQSQALIERGWTVVVVGYQGHTPTNKAWHFVELEIHHGYAGDEIRFLEFARKILLTACRLPLGRKLRALTAKLCHAHIPLWRSHTAAVRTFAKDHPELAGSLVLAHDFHSCEIAFALRDQFKCKISVDCHEYARGQYAHDPNWIKHTRPYVCGMQDFYLPKADSVTTVSSGIADRLNDEERLKQPAVVIRSMPRYQEFDPKPVGSEITVLYHGDISEIRGIHMAIESMPLWREEFHLIVRGSGDADYIASLKSQATKLGLSERVTIEPPVPFDKIVSCANQCDIGYFVHYDASPQKRFVLPNKFFEYINAGLALCVSDLPEMAALTRQYDLGHLVPSYDIEAIALCINAFDRDKIMYHKKKSIEAAKELNWEIEKTRLTSHYDKVCPS